MSDAARPPDGAGLGAESPRSLESVPSRRGAAPGARPSQVLGPAVVGYPEGATASSSSQGGTALERRLHQVFADCEALSKAVGAARAGDLAEALRGHAEVKRVLRPEGDVLWADGSRHACGRLLADGAEAGHEALVTWDEFRGLFAEPPRGPLSLDGSPKAWSHDGVAVEVRSRRSSQSSLRPSQSISPRAALTTYCRLSAQRPCSLVCVYTVILIILLAAFQREVIIKSDFSSFIRADGDCLRRMDAYSLALAERKRTSRRLAGSLVLERHLSLYYEPLDGGDVLNSRALREVKNFEAALTALPGWKRMCESRVPEPHQWLCTRGESLLSYVSADIVKAGESGAQWYSLVPDGQGIDMLSIPAVIAMMDHWTCVPSVFSNCEANLLDLHRFLPADFEAPAAGSAPAAAGGLKSAYVFRLKVTGLTDGSTQGSIMAEYEELFASEVYPFLTETPLQHVRVFFDGDTVEGHEVSLTLRNDAMWALGSTAMVLFFLWLHTRSVVVSLSVLLVMMLALPLAYVLTPVSITSASFLAIFLTIGIGSDVVFVFQDFWTQSEDQVQDEVRDKVCAPSFDARLIRRLELTLPAAFRNCLAAMSTTSASFLANMVSVLQPLREFGLYLGLCVMLAFLLLVLYMPPLMAWQERRRLPLEERRRLGGGEDLEKLSAIVPFEPGSAAAPETKLTPEPAVEPEPDAEPRPQHRSSRRPGLTSRLFRRLPVSIVLRVQRCPVAVVVVWTLCVLTFCILTGINMDVAKGVPDFFPKGHNQREIARMMDMFVSTEPLGLSISPPSSLRVCEAEPPSSALSQSYCDLHWCRRDAAGAPPDLVTAGGIGQCRTRLVGGQTLAVDESRWDFSSCSQVAVSGRAVSFFQNASESWAAFWESAASSMVGISSVSVSSVPGSDLPPLVLESWVSGSVDIAHLVRMPSYGVMLSLAEPGSESCVLEALCSFGVPPCEQDDGWLHLVEGCADFNGSYFDGAATMVIQQAATCTFTGTWQGSALSGSIAGGTMTIMEHPWGTNVVVGQLVGGSDIELSSGHTWSRVGARRMGAAAETAPSRQRPSEPWDVAHKPPLHGRALSVSAAAQVPPSKRIAISVVWGLRAAWRTPIVGTLAEEEIWSFDPTFDASDPWAQRTLHSMCEQANFPSELAILPGAQGSYCFAQKFKQYLGSRAERFPSRSFGTDVYQFWRSNLLSQDQVWMIDDTVRALKVTYEVDVSQEAGARALWEYKEKWDSWIDAVNSGASLTSNQAWHVASAWVQAEAEVAVIESTLTSIIVAVASGWLGVLAFTQDPYLACLVVGVVAGVIVGLAFFMICLAGWSLGPIEVIALIVFVGYSVTFSLHIAHIYHEEGRAQMPASQEHFGAIHARLMRAERARAAVARVGSATVAAAASTLAAGAFLCCCTMLIFVKLGAVVIVVTLLSGIASVVVLPAVLTVCGPDPGSCTQWTSRRCPRRRT